MNLCFGCRQMKNVGIWGLREGVRRQDEEEVDVVAPEEGKVQHFVGASSVSMMLIESRFHNFVAASVLGA